MAELVDALFPRREGRSRLALEAELLHVVVVVVVVVAAAAAAAAAAVVVVVAALVVDGWGGADASRRRYRVPIKWDVPQGGHTFASASFLFRCSSASVRYWLPYLLHCSSCTVFGLKSTFFERKATACTLASFSGSSGSSPRARRALRCARARRSFARLLACGGTVTARSA